MIILCQINVTDSFTQGSFKQMLKMILGWTQCMVPYCGSCDIKGRERHVGSYSLAQCKTECLKDNQCKGIDYGILPPNMYQCYFAFEDVKDVGTTFSLTFKAFRKQPCLGDTLLINDHSLLRVLNFLKAKCVNR